MPPLPFISPRSCLPEFILPPQNRKAFQFQDLYTCCSPCGDSCDLVTEFRETFLSCQCQRGVLTTLAWVCSTLSFTALSDLGIIYFFICLFSVFLVCLIFVRIITGLLCLSLILHAQCRNWHTEFLFKIIRPTCKWLISPGHILDCSAVGGTSFMGSCHRFKSKSRNDRTVWQDRFNS